MTQDADSVEPAAPSSSPPGPEASGSAPLGLLTFTLDGRRAPGLFLVGWLAILVGFGALLVGFFAQAGLAGGVLFVAGAGILSFGLVTAAGSQAIERQASGSQAYAGPSPIIMFAASVALTVFVVLVVGTPLVWLGMDPNGPLATVISLSVTVAAYVLLLRFLVVGTGALSWRDLGITRPSRESVVDVAWGVAFALPVLLVTGLLGALLSTFLPTQASTLPPSVDAFSLAANLLAAAVIAPIGEELFFRGFAQTAWARSVGPTTALARAALFFSLAHIATLGGDEAGEAFGVAVFVFVVRLPVAFALGWLFLRRRSIVAPIALHGVFNGLQVLALASVG